MRPLKVGDKVKLTGKSWETWPDWTASKIDTSVPQEVTEITHRGTYAGKANLILGPLGLPLPGYEFTRVKEDV